MMVVVRVGLVALVQVLLASAQHMIDDDATLQSLHLDAPGSNSTREEGGLEAKLSLALNTTVPMNPSDEGDQQTKDEEKNKEEPLTLDEETLISETLESLSPSDSDDDKKGKKPSVVPKKGVVYPKSSVVPKKGVSYVPSVVGKKGADPESATQSVSPRKGVELPEQKFLNPKEPIPYLLNDGKKNKSPLNTSSKHLQAISESAMQDNGKSTVYTTEQEGNLEASSAPTPQRINFDTKQVNVPLNVTKPLFSVNSSESHESLINLAKTNSSLHSKPAAAVDELDNVVVETVSINYTALVFGIIFFISFIVLMVIGYRKFQDVWIRRHYAHVDFLVEGMYDE